MRVVIVDCLADNYAYLLAGEGSASAAVVDPGEAEPVLRALDAEGLSLGAILNTHHHADHVAGNEALLRRFPGVPVFAHASDRGRIPGQTEGVEDGAALEAAGLTLRARHVPGHTLGAVAYEGAGALFTGDTLFGAGCGRVFEGTAAMLCASLERLTQGLPDETLVYSGHEYTAANLRFARAVEPENAAIRDRAARVEAARGRGERTVPSTLGEERATNPFLRCNPHASVADLPPGADRVAVFTALRSAKDRFRG